MKLHRTRLFFLTAISALTFAAAVHGAERCAVTTVANDGGLKGRYAEQFDRAEYEAAGNCVLSFAENPAFDADVKAGKLPPVADRLGADALVMQPYAEIGTYGGTMYGTATQPESGTSEILSWHHVNLVRYSDDQKTIVPYLAKDYEQAADLKSITFHLRDGLKWSDGVPFTADDIVFWYNDLQLNPELNPEPKSEWIIGGAPMKVEKLDDLTVKFSFAAPAPNFLSFMATSYIEFYRPKHFLEKFHPAYNPKANDDAKARGLTGWTQLMSYYYPPSDWNDVPQATLLAGGTEIAPTMESHIRAVETPTYREWKANPYFFAVDTAGNQLPYIDTIREDFHDAQLQTLRITQSGITLKAQDANFGDIAVYRENEQKGNYKTLLPKGGATDGLVVYGLNPLVPDAELGKLFADVRFPEALSLAINRDEINQLIYFGQGTPRQFVPVDHLAVDFVTEDQLNYFTQFDPTKANQLLDEMGPTARNADGFRLRADGQPIVLKLNYSLQGGPRQLHELVRDYWRAIGIKLELNELGSDELGSLLERNEHAIGSWDADGTGPLGLGNSARFAPPFNPRDIGVATKWRQFYDSKGKDGVEPPADVKRLYDIQAELNGVAVNSPEFKALVEEAIKIHEAHLFLIGLVGDLPKPIIVSNNLGNFPADHISFYGPYWHMSPYRPAQFFIKQN